jgi:hypothetical protein
MGSLMKLAERSQTENEEQISLAGKVKLACAHLYNFVGAAKEAGYEVKQASAESEINDELVKAAATLMVIDHYDLYKQAGINMESLRAILANIGEKLQSARAAGGSKLTNIGQKLRHPLTANIRGASGQMMGPGYLTKLIGYGPSEKLLELAAKPGVRAGAAGAAGAGGALGIERLLRGND